MNGIQWGTAAITAVWSYALQPQAITVPGWLIVLGLLYLLVQLAMLMLLENDHVRLMSRVRDLEEWENTYAPTLAERQRREAWVRDHPLVAYGWND